MRETLAIFFLFTLFSLISCSQSSDEPDTSPSAQDEPTPRESSTPSPSPNANFNRTPVARLFPVRQQLYQAYYDWSPSQVCTARYDGEATAMQKFLAKLSDDSSDVATREIFAYLALHPKEVFDIDEEGRGLMHWAVIANRLDIVEGLNRGNFKWGSSLRDRFGRTPLFYARSAEMVNKLWPSDAPYPWSKQTILDNPNDLSSRQRPVGTVRDENEQRPLHFMALSGQGLAVARVVEVACQGRLTLAFHLFGEDLINAQDSQGRTPLHLAAIKGDALSAQAIASCGDTRFSREDKMKRTALHYAASHADFGPGYQILKQISEDLMDEFVNLQDEAGNTALHIAYACESYDAVGALIQVGHASTQIPNAKGKLPAQISPQECLQIRKTF